MALVVADRVKESTTTTGTGTVNLAGAETGFQTFVAGIGNSNTTYYAIVDGNTGDFEVGIQVSRIISGSKENVIEIDGESLQKNSVIAYATGSSYRGTSFPTLVHLNEINPRDPDTTTYATASVTRGGTSVEFLESVQPFISSSRLSRFNLEKEFFYGSLSDSTSAGFGETYRIPSYIDRGELYVISQSFKRSEHESLFVDTISERIFYMLLCLVCLCKMCKC